MVSTIDNTTAAQPHAGQLIKHEPLMPKKLEVPPRHDLVELGLGNPLSPKDKQNIVLERAYNKLSSVVADARAALGIPEGAELDTSEEATAGRITDFALGFYDNYLKNNNLEDSKDSRKQFADFIGGAIGQGIDEARGILSSLNALDENSFSIDKTHGLVQSRLDDFVKNGLGGE